MSSPALLGADTRVALDIAERRLDQMPSIGRQIAEYGDAWKGKYRVSHVCAN